jgi:hypothetical protein
MTMISYRACINSSTASVLFLNDQALRFTASNRAAPIRRIMNCSYSYFLRRSHSV